ncbi:hypothetical protein OnM2_c5636o42 [Erysiphe neolycopersici]|uniref:Uncharacterized protein n=1 Tax=Erysiphe neolycopersici TaxID=212602 RepID=A0A420HNM6_9PEZI|nr:hypothetical protein OnM2_c5636o42 [Erysiphe neolycopersici]
MTIAPLTGRRCTFTLFFFLTACKSPLDREASKQAGRQPSISVHHSII